MFERFTENARNVVILAQEEAKISGYNQLYTHHLLLGLYRETEGLAGIVLNKFLGGAPSTELAHRFEHGPGWSGGHIGHSLAAKVALEGALREALELGHHPWIGTEHILLGLCRDPGLGLWHKLALDPIAVRQEVMLALNGSSDPEEGFEAEDAAVTMLREYREGIVAQIESWQAQVEEHKQAIGHRLDQIDDAELRKEDVDRALGRLNA